MTRARFGAACLLTGVAWSVFVIVVAGARYPGYSHVSDFISALGAHGARDGFAVSWAGFFVMGTLLAVGSVLVWPTFNGVALAACGIVLAGMSTFVGYAGSALWRCDFGCPETVHSSTQSLHFAVSAADLIGLSAGVALVAWSLRRKPQWRALARASATTAAVVLIGAFVLLAPSVDDIQGLLQRIIEGTTYAWFVGVALTALRNGTEYAQASED